MAKRKSVGHSQETTHPMPYLVLGQAEIPHIIEIGRRYELVNEQYLLSNHRDADIQIPSHAIPEHRVKLYLRDGQWHFENLSQRNDICLNDFPNVEAPLRDGNFLSIGQTVYQFLAGVGRQSNVFEAMYQAIRVDAHTKAYNKAHFWENISQWIAISQRHEQPLSLVMMDIDHFKNLNTVYGHLAADEILKMFSHRVRSRLRTEDSFYRVGGEEFAAILPETPKAKALKLAEELRQVVEKEPFLFQQQEIPATISLGVVSYRRGMTDESFYDAADKRMMEAKKTGRNKVIG